jgi:hypothetical protein
MKLTHRRALTFAAAHFTLSLLLAITCVMYGYGAALSDTYHSDPPWMRAVMLGLWALQLPVAALEALALRPSGSHGISALLLCVLGLFWSVSLGYAVPWITQALRKEK